MDFTVRYFKNDKVESRYLTSLFLGHTTAKDLKKKFEEATEQLDLKKLIQISMDGPNVNWKVLDLIAEDSNEQYLILLNVGSCSLHVVHGTFRNHMKQTNWGFPQQICGHRWLEDKKVAERGFGNMAQHNCLCH